MPGNIELLTHFTSLIVNQFAYELKAYEDSDVKGMFVVRKLIIIFKLTWLQTVVKCQNVKLVNFVNFPCETSATNSVRN